MDDARWRRLEEICHDALERDPDTRAEFVQAACGGDESLRVEVESLLVNATRAKESGLDIKGLGIRDLGLGLIGTQIGVYQILSLLGAGGMGEVYRARDTKLGRDVAIKILPPVFTNDPKRLARFEREARVLASLNHPHIGAIYGLEEDAGVRALVLELVEGETLAHRVRRGSVLVSEALSIARQIADALDTAHGKGVIHRDLKPANIKITPGGVVKVLDFGLAKAACGDALGTDLSLGPNVTADGTRQGWILGTPAYTSPEQARGQPVDKRTDIWAFGCVVYEMLTGRAAFDGETISDTIAVILEREPDWDALPEAIPAPIRRLLQRCLRKDSRQRLHDIADARIEIEEALGTAAQFDDVKAVSESLSPAVQRPAALTGLFSLARRPSWAAGVVIGLIIAAFLAGRFVAPRVPSSSTEARRFRITMPASVELPALGPQVALSPDGRTLVFRARTNDGVVRLYQRPLSALGATRIPGTEGVRYQGAPFFSPDGQWLAFLVGSKLMKVNLSGGQPEFLSELPRGSAELERPGWNWGGGSWGADGTLILALFEAGLVSVPATGGDPVVIAETDGIELWYMHPQILPGGRAVLFTEVVGPSDAGELKVLDLRTRRVHPLLRGLCGRIVPTGHLVFARAGTLWAARFDLDRLAVVGEPTPVEQGVRTGGLGSPWFAVADDGSLAYVAGEAEPPPKDTLVWVDRGGNETSIPGVPPHRFLTPRLSPQDDRVAVTSLDEEGARVQVWDFAGLTKLTSHQELNRFPLWTPIGQDIAYSVQRDGREEVYWQQPWDGAAESRPLTRGSPRGALPMAFAPDGTRLVTQSASVPPVISVFRLASGSQSTASLEHSFEGGLPAVSRDGRWIAYESRASGRIEVWVRPFPEVQARGKQVSTDGGMKPAWSRSTDELFFLESGGGRSRLMVVQIGPGITLSDPWPSTPLFVYPADWVAGLRTWRNYDVSKDGQRFLRLKPLSAPDAAIRTPEIIVVDDWFEELKRLVPTK